MIQPINNNNSTFKGYNIVQLPKKAFERPDCFLAVENQFTKICDKAVKMPKPWMLSIASFFGKIIMPQIDCFLEAPLFSDLINDLENIGGYSINWLEMHSGATIKPQMREGYHSFVVLTGDDQEKFRNLIIDYVMKGKADDLQSCLEERIKKGAVDDEISATATVYEKFSESFNEEFKDTKPTYHELNSLEELSPLIKKLHNEEP